MKVKEIYHDCKEAIIDFWEFNAKWFLKELQQECSLLYSNNKKTFRTLCIILLIGIAGNILYSFYPEYVAHGLGFIICFVPFIIISGGIYAFAALSLPLMFTKDDNIWTYEMKYPILSWICIIPIEIALFIGYCMFAHDILLRIWDMTLQKALT